MADVHVLGIRHHGPGSARSLVSALESIAPDLILVEGPPEASGIVDLVTDPEMRPPVAILAYDPAEPSHSAFYPFATFSPEWQALRFAAKRRVPVRFADLPLEQALAARPITELAELEELSQAVLAEEAASTPIDGEEEDTNPLLTDEALRRDPIGTLGQAIGEDGERWWDRFIEHRREAGDVFDAIALLMGELREGVAPTRFDALREAAMRTAIRAAEAEGAQRIAFVCGAFHVPALLDRSDPDGDATLLADLTRSAVETSWVPWSDVHLAMISGYGAGVASPGWYGHLWAGEGRLVETWLVRVARLLREEGFDISPAHLIEASRLAETTAALRGRGTPGLDEVNEAIRAVLTFGSNVPLAIIAERLIIGTGIGAVPSSVQAAPLARDLAAEQRRLRLAPSTSATTLELDLRKENDLARSHLLHRLLVLDVPWGQPAQDHRRAMGTFREMWNLRWDPMFAVSLVTQSRWGNTIVDAANARLQDEAATVDRLDELAGFLERSLYADLHEATAALTARVGALAAVAADVASLLSSLPPLARSLRYGSVRGHDQEALSQVVSAMLQRAAVGLPSAVGGLDDDGAAEMVTHVEHGAEAVGILDDPGLRDVWATALRGVSTRQGVHGLIVGRAVRLLLDGRRMEPTEAADRLAAALSRGAGPEYTIGFLNGFLAGSGALLVHDARLFGLVDDWLVEQSEDGFNSTLPYLRRTFARFSAAERRALRDRSRRRAAEETPSPTAAAATPTTAPEATAPPPGPAAAPPPAVDLLDSLLGLGEDDPS